MVKFSLQKRRLELGVCAGIIVAVVLTIFLYFPGLSGPFLLDDFSNITNSYVADFNYYDLLYSLTHNTSGLLGRPVSMASFLFSGVVHGPDAWGYKYHNLLLHLLNGLLIFWLLIKLLPYLNRQLDAQKTLLIAGFTALCWLLHPLMVSTVLYAVQRMAQLSSLFTLTALLLYVFARENLASGHWRFHFLLWILLPASMLLAVLSKENGALIPFYLFIIELLIFKFKTENKAQQKQLWVAILLFSILPIILGSIYLLTHLDSFINYSTRDFTMGQRLMTQLHVVTFYLKLTLLPALSDMSLFHDGWPAVQQMDWQTTALLMIYILALGLAAFYHRKAPVIAFGLAWFIASHLMESTILSLELVFEHRNYLAVVGILLIPIYYLFVYVESRFFRSISVVFILLLIFMTMSRVSEWSEEESIYSVAVLERPNSIRAHTAYASLLYRYGRVEESLEHIRAVQELDKTDFGSILHEIVYVCDSELYNDAMFNEAIRRASTYPVSPSSFYALDILMRRMRNGECPEVEPELLLSLVQAAEALEANQRNRNFTGFLQLQAAGIYYMQGNVLAGFENMINAYENSGQSSILVNLIEIQIQLGSYESAEQLINILKRRNAESFQSEEKVIQEVEDKLQRARVTAENV